MHSSKMRTERFGGHTGGGGGSDRHPLCGQTDAYENITFPILCLRAGISMHSNRMGTAHLLTICLLRRGGVCHMASWEGRTPPPPDRKSTFKNITLPHTSYPGDNYSFCPKSRVGGSPGFFTGVLSLV